MLLHFNLIEHHLEMGVGRKQKRRDWCTITEKSRKVLMYMEKIAEILTEKSVTRVTCQISLKSNFDWQSLILDFGTEIRNQ